jgi:hypothetical protein
MNKNKMYKYYFIYLTKNLINNKCYIGWHATNNLFDNYIGSGKILKKAIKKYGSENFINGIIEFSNEKEILKKEIYWIKEMKTLYPNGYNLTLGGEGSLGRKCSKKTRNKISISNKGHKPSEETLKKLSLSHKGIKPWNTGKTFSKEYKIRMSNSCKGINKGRIISKETRKKISLATKGIKKLSEKQKKQISLRHKGSTHNLIEVICPYCGLKGKGGNMTRYHFNNCKKALPLFQ